MAFDRFITDVNATVVGGSPGPAIFSKKLRYEDMNVSNGGVARDTAVGVTFEDMFSYSGSGILLGFMIHCQTLQDWTFKLTVDGDDIFGSNDLIMADFINTGIYGFGDLDPPWNGMSRSSNIFQYMSATNVGIAYATNITIQAKNPGGKQFKAGWVCLTKET